MILVRFLVICSFRTVPRCWYNPFHHWMYVIIFFFLTLFLLAVSDTMINDFCDGTSNIKGTQYFSDTVNQIDDTTGKWTSSLMCTSDICACPASTDFNLWTETELNSWNRTKSVITAAIPNTQYKILFKNTTTGSISYDSFYDCYLYILKSKNQYANSTSASKVTELSQDFVSL